MTEDTCQLHDCDKPIKRHGYCYGHYMKNWRYGSPTPTHAPRGVDITGQRFGTLTVVGRQGKQWLCRCDCGGTRLTRTGDLNRTQDKSTCGHRTIHHRMDTAGYGAAHQRCTADRGPASAHSCVDCGAKARHWSYDHEDPDEHHDEAISRNPIAYSLDPQHYTPRCVSCHKRFDLARVDAHR